MINKFLNSKKVGLALGSGSARGWSHIGVIRALEEANIKIDFIAGTSIGAFVGAFYASGNLDYLEEFALQMDWKAIVSFFDVGFPNKGLLDGERINQIISKQILNKNIKETKIPFCTVASDLIKGEEVIIAQGSIVDAVRASISIPGIFTPVKMDDNYLVDGGLINPVPVDVVRKMGAEVVIAVDLNHDILQKKQRRKEKQIKNEYLWGKKIENIISNSNIKAINTLKEKYQLVEKSVSNKMKTWSSSENDLNIFEIIFTSIILMEHRITQNNLKINKPDILIQPPLGHLGLFDFNQAEYTINEGYNAAKREIEKMRL